MSKREEQLSILRKVISDLNKEDRRAISIFKAYSSNIYIGDSLLDMYIQTPRDFSAEDILKAIDEMGEFQKNDWVIMIGDDILRSWPNDVLQEYIGDKIEFLLDDILGRGVYYDRRGIMTRGAKEVIQRILEIENS